MNIGVAEFRELIGIRENVRHSVESLELCWSCERICECEQWLVNGVVSLWLCGECVDGVCRRLEEQTGMPLHIERKHQGQAPTRHSQSGAPQIITWETARRQVWSRECPGCKAPIEKQRPSDAWKCLRCGWK